MTEVWAGEERRKHVRYPCAGEALVCQCGSDVSLEGQLSDISLGGCYLDMMNPLPSETEVELTLRVEPRQIQGRGRVRASRQGFGMGIAFTEMSPGDQSTLKELIQELGASYFRGPTEIAEPQSVSDSSSALEALLQLLERKGVIDHQEHADISKKSGLGPVSGE